MADGPLRQAGRARPTADGIIEDHIHVGHLGDGRAGIGADLSSIQVKRDAGAGGPLHAERVPSTCQVRIGCDNARACRGITTGIGVVVVSIVFVIGQSAGAAVACERVLHDVGFGGPAGVQPPERRPRAGGTRKLDSRFDITAGERIFVVAGNRARQE